MVVFRTDLGQDRLLPLERVGLSASQVDARTRRGPATTRSSLGSGPWGPTFRPGGQLPAGANVLDIAPTVLGPARRSRAGLARRAPAARCRVYRLSGLVLGQEPEPGDRVEHHEDQERNLCSDRTLWRFCNGQGPVMRDREPEDVPAHERGHLHVPDRVG